MDVLRRTSFAQIINLSRLIPAEDVPMSPFPTRRQFLRHTGLGAAGLLLANWVRAQTTGQPGHRGSHRIHLTLSQ